jgi:Nop14-like family
MADDDWHSDDDDDKGGLGRDVVNSLHFGGGMVATKGSNDNIYGPNNGSEGHGEGDNKAPKNRLDALQEIVAKSKMFKLQKKEAKEEQENDREKLDKDFQALVAGSMLDFRPTRQDRSELKDPNEVMDEYDISLRSMAFEVKARPSDRTKSDEEKAVEARDRLEELEAARLRRMNADSDPSDNAAADKALKNHSDAKKRKRVTDDEVDGSFGSNFAKNGDDEDDQDEDEEEEEEDDEEEGDEDDDEDDDDDEEDDDEEVDDENEEGDGDNDEEEDDWEEEDAEPVAVKAKTSKATSKKSAKVSDDQDEIDMDGDDFDDESDGEGDGQVEKKSGKHKEEEDDEVDEIPERKVKKLKKADRAVELLASEGE